MISIVNHVELRRQHRVGGSVEVYSDCREGQPSLQDGGRGGKIHFDLLEEAVVGSCAGLYGSATREQVCYMVG